MHNIIKNESQPSSFEKNLGAKRGQDLINKEESWDPEVFESLPNNMKEELLKSEQNSSHSSATDIETKRIVPKESVSTDKNIGETSKNICEASKNISETSKNIGETSAALPKKTAVSMTETIPENWDAQVFADLPKDIQKELLQNQKKDNPSKKKSTSSILNYFTKK